MRLFLVLSLFLAGSCTSTSDPVPDPVARPAYQWEPEPRALGEGRDGALAVTASEGVTLVWAGPSKARPGNDLYHARSMDGGDTFPAPRPVNAVSGEVKSHGETAPWVQIGPRQEVFVAWEGEGDVRFARSTDFGRSFQAPITLNDGPPGAHQSFHHMDSAPTMSVAAAWLDFRNQGMAALYAAVSRDRGATWAPNVKVAGDVCPCCRPSVLASPSGPLHVFWRHVYPTYVRDLAVSTSLDGGATWSAPVRVAHDNWVLDGCPHSGPTSIVMGKQVIVVWYTGAGDRPSLRMSRSADAGVTWTPAVEIQGNRVDANHPHLAARGGEAALIFQAREGIWGPTRPWVARVTPDGIGEPTPLPTLGGAVSYPRVAIGTAGRLYATWTETGPQGSKVVLCRGRLAR
jgi:hypothetical protein